jgi:ubiquinone/menaquinone biosynthesis C-methylase UbiE
MLDSTEERLLSHATDTSDMDVNVANIVKRIKQQGDKPDATVTRQLEVLEQLQQFEFGRFLLQNQGINGYWTHYMLTHPWVGRKTGKNIHGESFTPLEDYLLNRSPTMLATQQRFEIFLQQNQTQVKDNAKLACVPSGMLGELLYLDFSGIKDFTLVGIDYDPDALVHAKTLADKKGLTPYTQLVQGDAWNLVFHNEFDLVSSNGLNIYEPSSDKVTALYKQFNQALKPGGKLVTSFFTKPFYMTAECEWKMAVINQDDFLLQKIIFAYVVEAKWQQCFSSTTETRQQLETAGFTDIEFIYDEARMFPTVAAHKV